MAGNPFFRKRRSPTSQLKAVWLSTEYP
jgi:hypothetical protein